MSLKEIAAVLGIPLSAARVRLCHGVKAFEEEFKAGGGEDHVV
jgi:DNA-directed RNA polymerase specialized sigma24 family protein